MGRIEYSINDVKTIDYLFGKKKQNSLSYTLYYEWK